MLQYSISRERKGKKNESSSQDRQVTQKRVRYQSGSGRYKGNKTYFSLSVYTYQLDIVQMNTVDNFGLQTIYLNKWLKENSKEIKIDGFSKVTVFNDNRNKKTKNSGCVVLIEFSDGQTEVKYFRTRNVDYISTTIKRSFKGL